MLEWSLGKVKACSSKCSSHWVSKALQLPESLENFSGLARCGTYCRLVNYSLKGWLELEMENWRVEDDESLWICVGRLTACSLTATNNLFVLVFGHSSDVAVERAVPPAGIGGIPVLGEQSEPGQSLWSPCQASFYWQVFRMVYLQFRTHRHKEV